MLELMLERRRGTVYTERKENVNLAIGNSELKGFVCV